MKNLKSNSYSSMTINSGFTLIELIIVIIILGILSTTVAPKFFTSSGFSEYVYRSDAIAKLRLIQIKAMQQTGNNASDCHQVLVTNKKLGAPDDCDDSPSYTDAWDANLLATGMEIDGNDNVSFTTDMVGNKFSFDSLGRPISCGPCVISINGEQTVKIQIEKEGYIHGL
jgi:MSHA pilin protein MshC